MSRHQFNAGHAFTRSHKAAARAAQRGDLVAADKWLKIAERHTRLALNLIKLADAEREDEIVEHNARLQKRLKRKAGW